MSSYILFVIITVVLFGCSRNSIITIDELTNSHVIGKLGLRMGECAEIVAEVVPTGEYKCSRDYYLHVQRINGMPCDIKMEFNVHSWVTTTVPNHIFDAFRKIHSKESGRLTDSEITNMNNFYKGKLYKLIVYEMFCLDGFPDNPKGYEFLAWQDRGLWLNDYLIVTNDLGPG